MRKGVIFKSTECPECGNTINPLVQTGHDEDGRMIRLRKCSNCGKKFGTIETGLPDEFSFSKTDIDKDNRRTLKRVALYSPDRIVIGSIRIIKGTPTPYCASGKHFLRGKNLIMRKQGRLCKACQDERIKEYRMRNRTVMQRKRREAYHRDLEKSRRLNREAYQRRKAKKVQEKES